MNEKVSASARLRAAFFDLDGTLFFAEGLHRQSVSAVFEEQYRVSVDPDEMRAYVGLTYEERFEHMLHMRGMDAPPELLRELADAAWKKTNPLFTPKQLLVPGASDFLQHLQLRGIKIAVVSSGKRDYITSALTRAVLISFVDTITGIEDTALRKPHPEPYTFTLARMNLTADTVVAFEDSPAGVESAWLAGIRVIALDTTFSADDLEKSVGVIHDYRGLTLEKIASMI